MVKKTKWFNIGTYAIIVTAICVGVILYFGGSFEQEEAGTFVRELSRQLGIVIIATSVITLLFKFVQDKYISIIIEKGLGEIREKITSLELSQSTGITGCYSDCRDYKEGFQDILLNSKRLTVIAMNLKSWVEIYKNEISKRLKNRKLKTTIILLDKETPEFDLIASRTDQPPEEFAGEIDKSNKAFIAINTESQGKLLLKKHTSMLAHGIYKTDDRIVITPYCFKHPKGLVPTLLVFDNTTNEDMYDYFSKEASDLEKTSTNYTD